MSRLPVPRPFVKWAGGKGQLIPELLRRRPAQFGVYHEPFLGGGVLFFALCREGLLRRAILSDLNAELIDTYVAIRDEPQAVLSLFQCFPHEKGFYYELRAKDPWQLSRAERAARLIYLNRTGYNGLYRVNRQGRFNVPFGSYKSPVYADPENLWAVSKALQNVELLAVSYETVLGRAQAGDWVYFDPPYVPLSPTASFTAYQPAGFTPLDQGNLREVCRQLSENGVYVLVFNADVPLIHALYADVPFRLETVWASRTINARSDRRGKVHELLISNYATP